MVCILIILGLCHPTPTQLTLGSIQATSSFVDMYGTLRNMNPRPNVPTYKGIEHNPIERPFVSHGSALGYTSAAADSIGVAFIGHKMKNSRTWVRHVWWLPQVVSIAAHTSCAAYSFTYHIN